MTTGRRFRRKPVKLQDALTQVQTAVRALGEAADVPEALKTLAEQTERVESLADALVSDYQTLVTELDVQREVTLRLITMTPGGVGLDTWRSAEALIREQVISERESRTEAPADGKVEVQAYAVKNSEA